jgi:hypothetical protein
MIYRALRIARAKRVISRVDQLEGTYKIEIDEDSNKRITSQKHIFPADAEFS